MTSKESEGSRFGTLRHVPPSADILYSSEGPLETPRPLVRNGSHRFPVKSNGNGLDSSSASRSPGFAKPPIPTRSHYRVTSGQNNMMPKPSFRRPGVTPLHIGNERNRSNSESVLQVTQNNRSKRMGMVTKKKNDLVTVKENQQNRNSFHLRGQSHASALREWQGEEHTDSSAPAKAHHKVRQRNAHPVHRYGSLTPHLSQLRKDGSHRKRSAFGDTAKCLRYSLSTFEQCTKSLIESLPNRQWSRIRDAQHDAEFSMLGLLHSVNSLILEEKNIISSTHEVRKESVTFSINACLSAIARYTQLGNMLLQHSAQILAQAGRMYFRTIVVCTLGSSTEACHAVHSYAQRSKRSTITQTWCRVNKPPILNGRHILQDGPFRDQSLTPTRERPVTAKRIVKTGTTPPQQTIPSVKPAATTQPAVPLYPKGRSRSNSRADQYPPPSSTDSTFPFSPAMTPSLTPQSSGLFSVPGTPLNRSRSSSIAAGPHSGRITPLTSNPYYENDYGLQAQFDRVYSILEPTVIQSRKVLPILREHFIQYLNEAQTDRDRTTCENWSRRVRTCSVASEIGDAMLKRLHTVRFQDPSLRNDKSFWDLCKKFLAALSDLFNDVRSGLREGFLKQDIANMVRPIIRSSRDATLAIQESPWDNSGYLSHATTSTNSPAASIHSNSNNNVFFGHSRQRRSSGSSSTMMNNTAAAIPSTPLSAALGPAAQATVPSTPASGSLERSFHGNFFERADALQQMQQTMVYRR
ncbi:MAG: hypothetical protein Q9172_006795 [Xanthocarpia lactea]